MEISLQLVAANCNPVHHGLARLPNSNIVAYCAANQVLIHNTKQLNTAVSLNLNRILLYLRSTRPGQVQLSPGVPHRNTRLYRSRV